MAISPLPSVYRRPLPVTQLATAELFVVCVLRLWVAPIRAPKARPLLGAVGRAMEAKDERSPAGARAAAVDELQAVMCLIDDRLARLVQTLPHRYRRLTSNAMLNLAVNRLIAVEGPQRASTILYRLADLVASRRQPHGTEAFPLTGHDA
jgi:hypothetical protein